MALLAAGAAHLLNNVTLTVASQLLFAEEALTAGAGAAGVGAAGVGAAGAGAAGAEELGIARRALELNTSLAKRLSALAQAHGPRERIELDVASELAMGVARARERAGTSEVPIETRTVSRLVRVAPLAIAVITEELVANALEAGARHVSVRAITRGGHLVVRVDDDGAGMTKELARLAPDPFVTTRPRARHCGLGLTLVRAWTDGRLRIAPRASGGTTISARLAPR